MRVELKNKSLLTVAMSGSLQVSGNRMVITIQDLAIQNKAREEEGSLLGSDRYQVSVAKLWKRANIN